MTNEQQPKQNRAQRRAKDKAPSSKQQKAPRPNGTGIVFRALKSGKTFWQDNR